MSKESKQLQGQATPRELKDLKIAHEDFVLVKDREGFLRKQRSLEQLMEHYASKEDQPDGDKDDSKSDDRKVGLSALSRGMGIKGVASQKNVPQRPPSFCANIRYPHKFYFRVNSAMAASTITVGNLLSINGVVGTSTTAATAIASAVKLNSVTVWPAAGAVTANPEIAFAGSGYGTNPEQSIERAIPSGVTIGGGLKFIVPDTALAGMWQNSTSYSVDMFILYDIPSGSVICVSGYWALRDSLPGLNVTGFTTMAIGSYMYTFLDGNAAHKCTPVGLPNTF